MLNMNLNCKQEMSLQFLLNNILIKKYVNNGFVYDNLLLCTGWVEILCWA